MKHHAMSESPPLPGVGQPSGGAVDSATLELLATWKQEDAILTPDEVRAAQQELNDFKKAMNEIRSEAGELPLYP
jgi:hypothetical protein